MSAAMGPAEKPIVANTGTHVTIICTIIKPVMSHSNAVPLYVLPSNTRAGSDFIHLSSTRRLMSSNVSAWCSMCPPPPIFGASVCLVKKHHTFFIVSFLLNSVCW